MSEWLKKHHDPSEPVREYTHDWACIDCGAVTRYPVALTRPSQIGCWRCGMQLSRKSLRLDDKRVKLFDPETDNDS